MRRIIVLSAAVLSLSALSCSKSPRDRLQGKWLGDSIANVTSEQTADVMAWVKGTSLDFSGDRMTVTIPAEQPRSGEFKVAKAEGNRLTVQVTREGGTDTARLVMADETTLRMDVGAGREIVLTKLK